MKSQIRFLTGVVVAAVFSAAVATQAQYGRPGAGGPGGPPPGPQFNGAMAKLFGDHQSFSATTEFDTDGGAGSGGGMKAHGKMAFMDGKCRFEMDMSTIQGANIPPQALQRMKQMGLDKMVSISLPDKKVNYTLYPNMNAYLENPLSDSGGAASPSDYKVDVTEQGAETVEGHPCVKNKVVVTGPDGAAHESTVWNATDLDKFPVKIVSGQEGRTVTMVFNDVKLDKPDASLFDPPSDYKKYDSMMALMMSHMQQR